MRGTLTEKILASHLVAGSLTPGEEIQIRVDQTLTQDATGTMAFLQFEALGVSRVRTELSVSYVDHNTLQAGFESADDHRYLQTAAAKYGVQFSRPGNGICHQVHLDRFGAPGKTLLGSDSHTPTAGGLGMIGLGAGGLDVALAMAGLPFTLVCPQVLRVHLTGSLPPWVSAKDVILELLRRLTVKGGVGKLVEYTGPGVATLGVPERATITNMGAELGATSSVFPSDEQTRAFLAAQEREEAWRPLAAEPDAEYAETVELDLAALEPLVAQPHMPDRVVPVAQVAGTPVDQVCIGSCTNSSLRDLLTVAAMLRGQRVHPRVSLTLSPGSRQVLTMIARSGALADLVAAGARVLESACGPCIGMGQAPVSEAVSVRSFNRNFAGRSGTASAQVYLAGPQVCAAAALTGALTDPRALGEAPRIELPERYEVDDGMILPPAADPEAVEVVRGPNIRPVPMRGPLEDEMERRVLLKAGDNITTDDIMPAGAKVLPLRSNLPALSRYVFSGLDPGFAERAEQGGGGFVVGGENYGQGSSREHAALAPMHLGVRAVLAEWFARIHQANLVNFGLLPLRIAAEDYQRLAQGDTLRMNGVRQAVTTGGAVTVEDVTQGFSFPATPQLSPRQAEVLLAGGVLNWVREQAG